jgi:hypothetical protein
MLSTHTIEMLQWIVDPKLYTLNLKWNNTTALSHTVLKDTLIYLWNILSLNPKWYTINPVPYTVNPKCYNMHLKHYTLHPKQ